MTKDIWQQKSDEELITASEHLSEFTKEAEETIRAELKRRHMPEPEPTVGTIDVMSRWRENAAIDRYLDLYRVARLQIRIGTIVKAVGIVMGAGIFLIAFLVGVSSSTSSREFETGVGVFFVLTLVGAVYGAVLGGFVFLFGVMISAQGQTLLAQADAAIHTSPFLTKEEKATAMALPYQDAEQIGPPDHQRARKCPDCAEVIKLEARVCRFCSYRFSEDELALALKGAEEKHIFDKERLREFTSLEIRGAEATASFTNPLEYELHSVVDASKKVIEVAYSEDVEGPGSYVQWSHQGRIVKAIKLSGLNYDYVSVVQLNPNIEKVQSLVITKVPKEFL